MQNIWLEVFLGKIGKYFILFIDRYYLYILPLIIIYGIFLTIASLNLKKIKRKICLDIINQVNQLKNLDSSLLNNSEQLIENIKVDWEKFIKLYSFFPYITSQNNLWVVRTNAYNVRESILPEKSEILRIICI